ncbi:hypothetical protein BDZ89DRAFT_1224213 [Hymenopellis radicata]|nr:hypothetical protein BDZ89DRAFT_1224213 [Hymenopellis radicata]
MFCKGSPSTHTSLSKAGVIRPVALIVPCAQSFLNQSMAAFIYSSHFAYSACETGAGLDRERENEVESALLKHALATGRRTDMTRRRDSQLGCNPRSDRADTSVMVPTRRWRGSDGDEEMSTVESIVAAVEEGSEVKVGEWKKERTSGRSHVRAGSYPKSSGPDADLRQSERH